MNSLPLTSCIEALGWMLLHFVWQGAAIAAALECVLRAARAASPQLRYGAACAALLTMLAIALGTFVATFNIQARSVQRLTSEEALPLAASNWTDSPVTNDAAPARQEPSADHLARPAVVPSVPSFSTITAELRPWLSWIVSLWVLGVGFHSLRCFVGWRAIRGLRAEACELDDALWMERFERLRQRLGVARGVRLLASASAVVPMVIGYLKPVVLIPTSLLTGLTRSQVEAILVHELTHIRRHDYLVNLLQNMVETLFFYHPALWWVSAQIRTEREHCCDDAASAACGDLLEYARALTALEELRSISPALTVAASGGSLLDRIRRLIGVQQPAPSRALWPAWLLSLLLIPAVALPLAMLQAEEGQTPAADAVQKQREVTPSSPSPQTASSTDQRDEAPKQPLRKIAVDPNPNALHVSGKIVDADTGEPVNSFIIQGGKVDPADHNNVVWGFGEDRGHFGNSFSVVRDWSQGWTARIVADGYLPHPVFPLDLPADAKALEVTIRLQHGRLVRGRVMDHTGQPVKTAAVFAVGPIRLNLSAGKAWTNSRYPNPAKFQVDDTVMSVSTDVDGRFEIPAGGATSLAVSCTTMDAWEEAIPKEGDAVIRLPAAATLEIEYKIEGAEDEGVIYYQRQSRETPGFQGVELTQVAVVKNGERQVQSALPPGTYRIWRQKMNRVSRFGKGVPLDGDVFTLQPGEIKTVRLVRETGARLRGKVVGAAGMNLDGIIVSVLGEELDKGPFSIMRGRLTYAALRTAEDGTFHTERIAAGRYKLLAEGYSPVGSQQVFPDLVNALNASGPSHRAEMTIDVPQSGEVVVPDLLLK